MAVWICRELPCSVSSVLIYYAPELDIRVKSYDHLNFSRASVVQFQASWYIMGLNRTPMLKVMAISIGRELSCSISTVLIYYALESDIRVKSYDLLNFSGASVVHFQPSWYIMGVNHSTESKVMPVWICWELSCSVSTVSIYYAPESNIRVKSYDHLNFSGTFFVHFLLSWCIMACHIHPSQKLRPFEFAESFCV